MIGYLKGPLTAIDKTRVLILIANVGYWVTVSPQLLAQLTPNTETELYIHTHVREDALSLFGFASLADLRLFEQLITVSGIGPKLALNVFAAGNSGTISRAIETADPNFFTAVPGIGKKNAQRLIIDLKGKVGALGAALDLSETDSELVRALVSFGFSKDEIKLMTKNIDPALKLEEQVKLALKNQGV